MTAAERMAQDPRYKNSLLNALTQPKQDASQEQAAAPGAALTVPKADDGDMYGGKALFSKPTWRERKTKVVEAGQKNDFLENLALPSADPGPPMRHKPSVVDGGLFGGADLKAEEKREKVGGGLFDESDDERELADQRKQSNIEDLLGGGKEKIQAAASKNKMTNLFAVDEIED